MTKRILISASVLGATVVLLTLGCGQPRVYVTTSTTVGFEATPPMSDGSGVPRVMLGYKRAEVAFIPVCPVERYKYTWTWLDNLFNFSPKNIEKCQSNKGDDKVKKDPSADHNPEGSRYQSGTRSTDPARLERQDAYSTLGLFRLGLSWFGPAKIEQFFATGQAAIALQEPLAVQKKTSGDASPADSPPKDQENAEKRKSPPIPQEGAGATGAPQTKPQSPDPPPQPDNTAESNAQTPQPNR